MYPLDFWGYKGFAFDKHDFKAWIIGGVILGEPRISVSPSGKKRDPSPTFSSLRSNIFEASNTDAYLFA